MESYWSTSAIPNLCTEAPHRAVLRTVAKSQEHTKVQCIFHVFVTGFFHMLHSKIQVHIKTFLHSKHLVMFHKVLLLYYGGPFHFLN